MSKDVFGQAVAFFVHTTRRIPPEAWDSIALGEWTVRDLVGHTSRAMLTVEQYATAGADREGFGSSDDIADHGRAAGRDWGDAPTQTVDDIAQRVTALVASLPDDHPMNTPAGTRPLVRYLQSRITELTIHTLDLADAIGLTSEAPDECLRLTLYGLADIAVRTRMAKDVAFGLTGRRALGEGFTLVP
jgi:uncharacterized protein (TIGR03083 family)